MVYTKERHTKHLLTLPVSAYASASELVLLRSDDCSEYDKDSDRRCCTIRSENETFNITVSLMVSISFFSRMKITNVLKIQGTERRHKH